MKTLLLALAAVLLASPVLAQSTLYSNSTTGNVGIGTTNPGALFTVGNNAFEVNSSGDVTAGIWQGTQIGVAYGGTNCTSASITCFNNITGYSAAGTTGTSSTNLVFSTSPSITTPTFVTSATGPIIYGGTSAGSTLTLDGTSNGSPSSAYVLLNPSGQGNVGIGTATPGNPLSVYGVVESETGGFKFPDGKRRRRQVVALSNIQTFTSSGTWTKPSGVTTTHIECWGGGGSGASSNGGGGAGGGYAEGWIPTSSLSSTVTVTVGSGASTNSGTAGGNTTFGSLLTAYGGGSAGAGSPRGGCGGSPLNAGANDTNGGSSSYLCGFSSATDGNTGGAGGCYGGGTTCSSSALNNSNSVHGGAGGAPAFGTAGSSSFGGNGGSPGNGGTQPGGGGGYQGAGAAGKCIVTSF